MGIRGLTALLREAKRNNKTSNTQIDFLNPSTWKTFLSPPSSSPSPALPPLLLSFFTSSPHPLLLIDSLSLLFSLFQYDILSSRLFPSYDIINERIIQFIDLLLVAEIDLVFYFDTAAVGNTQGENHNNNQNDIIHGEDGGPKMKEMLSRTKEKMKEIALLNEAMRAQNSSSGGGGGDDDFFSSPTSLPSIHYRLLKSQFLHSLSTLSSSPRYSSRLFLHFCIGESDIELSSHSSNPKVLGILSTDSDFAIMKYTKWISIDTFKFVMKSEQKEVVEKYKGMIDNKFVEFNNNSPRSPLVAIVAECYSSRTVAELLSIPTQHLSDLSILLGNDFSKSFLPFLPFESLTNHKVSISMVVDRYLDFKIRGKEASNDKNMRINNANGEKISWTERIISYVRANCNHSVEMGEGEAEEGKEMVLIPLLDEMSKADKEFGKIIKYCKKFYENPHSLLHHETNSNSSSTTSSAVQSSSSSSSYGITRNLFNWIIHHLRDQSLPSFTLSLFMQRIYVSSNTPLFMKKEEKKNHHGSMSTSSAHNVSGSDMIDEVISKIPNEFSLISPLISSFHLLFGLTHSSVVYPSTLHDLSSIQNYHHINENHLLYMEVKSIIHLKTKNTVNDGKVMEEAKVPSHWMESFDITEKFRIFLSTIHSVATPQLIYNTNPFQVNGNQSEGKYFTIPISTENIPQRYHLFVYSLRILLILYINFHINIEYIHRILSAFVDIHSWISKCGKGSDTYKIMFNPNVSIPSPTPSSLNIFQHFISVLEETTQLSSLCHLRKTHPTPPPSHIIHGTLWRLVSQSKKNETQMGTRTVRELYENGEFTMQREEKLSSGEMDNMTHYVNNILNAIYFPWGGKDNVTSLAHSIEDGIKLKKLEEEKKRKEDEEAGDEISTQLQQMQINGEEKGNNPQSDAQDDDNGGLLSISAIQNGTTHLLPLPIDTLATSIISSINTNELLLIHLSTGGGKSSRVPLFLLYDWYSQKQTELRSGLRRKFRKKFGDMTPLPSRLGKHPFIVVTQPRRMAAIRLCERVSEETKEKPGELVGYSIGQQRLSTKDTRILFVTIGWLLTKLIHSPSFLMEITHLVLDEIHERSVESDLMLVFLKITLHRIMKQMEKNMNITEEVVRRMESSKQMGQQVEISVNGVKSPVKSNSKNDSDSNDIADFISHTMKTPKILLMSATLNSDLFSSYFSTPLVQSFGGTIGDGVKDDKEKEKVAKKKEKKEKKKSKMIKGQKVTDPTDDDDEEEDFTPPLLLSFFNSLDRPITLDLSRFPIDIFYLSNLLHFTPIRQHIENMKKDRMKYRQYGLPSPTFSDSSLMGLCQRMDEKAQSEPKILSFHLEVATFLVISLSFIHHQEYLKRNGKTDEDEEQGGQDDVGDSHTMEDEMKNINVPTNLLDTTSLLIFLPGLQELESLADSIDEVISQSPYLSSIIHIFLLHSSIDPEDQYKIFSPLPPGHSRVIISTNIAESSVTIPDVKYIIDFGLAKQNQYSDRYGCDTLKLVRTSRASGNQRRGRCGRTQPGVCFRLYSETCFNTIMREFDPSEITRTDLSAEVLQLKLTSESSGDTTNTQVFRSPHFILLNCIDPPSLSQIEEAYVTLLENRAVVNHLIMEGKEENEDNNKILTIDGRDQNEDSFYDPMLMPKKRKDREEFLTSTLVTPLGRFFSKFPFSFAVAKVIALGVICGPKYICGSIIIASAISSTDIWISPHPRFTDTTTYAEMTYRRSASQVWADGNMMSDPLATMRMLEAYLIYFYHSNSSSSNINATPVKKGKFNNISAESSANSIDESSINRRQWMDVHALHSRRFQHFIGIIQDTIKRLLDMMDNPTMVETLKRFRKCFDNRGNNVAGKAAPAFPFDLFKLDRVSASVYKFIILFSFAKNILSTKIKAKPLPPPLYRAAVRNDSWSPSRQSPNITNSTRLNSELCLSIDEVPGVIQNSTDLMRVKELQILPNSPIELQNIVFAPREGNTQRRGRNPKDRKGNDRDGQEQGQDQGQAQDSLPTTPTLPPTKCTIEMKDLRAVGKFRLAPRFRVPLDIRELRTRAPNQSILYPFPFLFSPSISTFQLLSCFSRVRVGEARELAMSITVKDEKSNTATSAVSAISAASAVSAMSASSSSSSSSSSAPSSSRKAPFSKTPVISTVQLKNPSLPHPPLKWRHTLYGAVIDSTKPLAWITSALTPQNDCGSFSDHDVQCVPKVHRVGNGPTPHMLYCVPGSVEVAGQMGFASNVSLMPCGIEGELTSLFMALTGREDEIQLEEKTVLQGGKSVVKKNQSSLPPPSPQFTPCNSTCNKFVTSVGPFELSPPLCRTHHIAPILSLRTSLRRSVHDEKFPNFTDKEGEVPFSHSLTLYLKAFYSQFPKGMLPDESHPKPLFQSKGMEEMMKNRLKEEGKDEEEAEWEAIIQTMTSSPQAVLQANQNNQNQNNNHKSMNNNNNNNNNNRNSNPNSRNGNNRSETKSNPKNKSSSSHSHSTAHSQAKSQSESFADIDDDEEEDDDDYDEDDDEYGEDDDVDDDDDDDDDYDEDEEDEEFDIANGGGQGSATGGGRGGSSGIGTNGGRGGSGGGRGGSGRGRGRGGGRGRGSRRGGGRSGGRGRGRGGRGGGEGGRGRGRGRGGRGGGNRGL